jgi:hypothetical protein
MPAAAMGELRNATLTQQQVFRAGEASLDYGNFGLVVFRSPDEIRNLHCVLCKKF